MKKNEYVAPEMEIVEIEVNKPLLDTSTEAGGEGTGFPPGFGGGN